MIPLAALLSLLPPLSPLPLLAPLRVPTPPAAPPGINAPPPPALADVGVNEHPGAQVPLDLVFFDSTGNAAPLRSFVSGRRPVLLTLVYYRCPMLCNLVLANLVGALLRLDWRLGRQYDALTVSFDPTESPRDALERQHGYLSALGHGDAPQDWPFLTGREPAIRALADAVGFRYRYDDGTRQFAHTAVVFVLTPRGTVSRYLYGIDFPQKNLKLALYDAADGRVGGTFERILLSCYSYDPAARRYHLYVYGFLRAGALLVFLALSTALVRFWRLERRRAHT